MNFQPIPQPPIEGEWQPLPQRPDGATVWEKRAPHTPGSPDPATYAPPTSARTSLDGQWRDARTRRMRARAAEKRTDRHDAIELERERRQLAREDRAARHAAKIEQRRLKREDRKARRAERRALNAERDARIKKFTADAARRFMVVVPILAPMAVAWTGQADFALDVLNWGLVFAVGFAAAWELSTAFVAWMYHQARQDGDDGTLYRFATWVFAGGAAAMNYWHAAPDWEPNPVAVSYATMSMVGIGLWEFYARLVHRRHLRAKGLLPAVRPKIGAVRWLRYPRHSWTAWSLTISRSDLDTLDKAWTAAAQVLADRRAVRTGEPLSDRYAVTVHTRATDHGPASVPVVRVNLVRADRGPQEKTADRVVLERLDRTTVDRAPDRTAKPAVDRTARPKELDRGPDRDATPNAARSEWTDHGPDHQDTVDRAQRTALADRTDRTVGPNQDRTEDGPRATDRTVTATTDRKKADRTAPVQQKTGPDRATADRTGHKRPTAQTGPDRTDTDLVLTDLEQQAIDFLRTADRSISKRSICDAVRNELKGSIASDRALEIARHYRTLRSAA